jgi:hypothetical protein
MPTRTTPVGGLSMKPSARAAIVTSFSLAVARAEPAAMDETKIRRRARPKRMNLAVLHHRSGRVALSVQFRDAVDAFTLAL